MNTYRILHNQIFRNDKFSLVPIRMEDRYIIMQWRNEQLYHLRQDKPLTMEEQDNYFSEIISPSFSQEFPSQILFSLIQNNECIGYGGLVHINWVERNAELSFLINTTLEKGHFNNYWRIFLLMIDEVAFIELGLNKIYTCAFDVRPHLYPILETNGFSLAKEEAVNVYSNCKDSKMVIHEKIPPYPRLRIASPSDLETTFRWASDPMVRKYSFHKNKITCPEHQEWFLNRIKNDDCEYYIFYNQYESLGSIRYDIENDDSGRISYLIDPHQFNKGYGQMIFGMGIDILKKRKPGLRRIYGFIESENIACLKVVEYFGFSINLEMNLYKVSKTL
jgi:RimJ/RimL family protein N-acetyltransferase